LRIVAGGESLKKKKGEEKSNTEELRNDTISNELRRE